MKPQNTSASAEMEPEICRCLQEMPINVYACIRRSKGKDAKKCLPTHAPAERGGHKAFENRLRLYSHGGNVARQYRQLVGQPVTVSMTWTEGRSTQRNGMLTTLHDVPIAPDIGPRLVVQVQFHYAAIRYPQLKVNCFVRESKSIELQSTWVDILGTPGTEASKQQKNYQPIY